MKVANTCEGFRIQRPKGPKHLLSRCSIPSLQTGRRTGGRDGETHHRFVRDGGKEREREREREREKREVETHTDRHTGEQRGTAAHRRAYLKLQVVTRGFMAKINIHFGKLKGKAWRCAAR